MLSHVSTAFSNQAREDLIFQIMLYAIKQNQFLGNCYFVLYAVKPLLFFFSLVNPRDFCTDFLIVD